MNASEASKGLLDDLARARGKTARVHCGPLTTYLRDLGVSHVDFFSLDVEGAEFRVLSTLDLDAIRVDVMIVESYNRDCVAVCPHRDAVRALMRARNYTRIEHEGPTRGIPRSDLFVHPAVPIPKNVWNYNSKSVKARSRLVAVPALAVPAVPAIAARRAAPLDPAIFATPDAPPDPEPAVAATPAAAPEPAAAAAPEPEIESVA